MGTEISEEDITNIRHLCAQVRLVQSFIDGICSTSRVRICTLEHLNIHSIQPIIYDDVSYRPSLNTQVDRSHTEIIGHKKKTFFLNHSIIFEKVTWNIYTNCKPKKNNWVKRFLLIEIKTDSLIQIIYLMAQRIVFLFLIPKSNP